MKILIFSLAYFPEVGGAEIAIKEITDRLPDTECHLIALRFSDAPQEERVGKVVVHRVGQGGSYLQKILYVPRAARLACALHAQHSFDLAWAMMSYMLFPVVLARARGVRVPYLLSLQEGDPFEHVFARWRILPLLPLLRYGFRHAAAVQAISTFLGSWAGEAGYHGEVTVIPNGVDLTRFVQTHTHAQHIEGLRLVTTSRLVPKNALDDVIRALVFLPESVTFSIYGTGPEEGRLRQLAQDLQVAPRVHLKGYVAHTELPAALADADIFVRPSRSEGMGNSFIEAMAVGLPVVATQVGGISDFLFDAKRNPDKPTTGWAVAVGAPEQIAAAVKDIATNPTKTSRATANAVRLVRERYSWDRVAHHMRALFLRISTDS